MSPISPTKALFDATDLFLLAVSIVQTTEPELADVRANLARKFQARAFMLSDSVPQEMEQFFCQIGKNYLQPFDPTKDVIRLIPHAYAYIKIFPDCIQKLTEVAQLLL